MNEDRVDRDNGEHLREEQVVAFLAHELRGEALSSVERHLADCEACRDEIVAVSDIFQPGRGSQRIRWRVLVPTAAAAAIALLVLAGPPRERLQYEGPRHRDAPAQLSVDVTPVAPLGGVERVDRLVWRAVPGADRYRLTLFDEAAAVLWRTTTEDTIVALPDSIHLLSGVRYLWRLEARVGWDLWEASDLAEFTIEPRDRDAAP